jgi:hypothetical protein
MGEIARPMDLALHGWGREFEEMAAAARELKFQREKELERGKKWAEERAITRNHH